MKLKQYIINEGYKTVSKDSEKTLKLLKKDCSPYLSLLRSNNIMPFVKGVRINVKKEGLLKKDTRVDRKSQGMSQHFADKFNKWLIDNNHVPRTSSVICTSDRQNAQEFGLLCYIFPIGKIEYTWAETKDINRNNAKTGWYSYAVEDYVRYTGSEENRVLKMDKPFPDYFHTNKDIKTAYKNGYEVWFKCKSYYLMLVNDDNKESIKNALT